MKKTILIFLIMLGVFSFSNQITYAEEEIPKPTNIPIIIQGK